MKAKYYTLFEPGEINHIGTVKANTTDELKLKTEEACKCHFDSECDASNVDFGEVLQQMNKVPYVSFEINIDDGGDNWDKEIGISETWIY